MAESRPIRIIIADDHKLFRSGILSLLDEARGIHIIGEAENGQELIGLYEKQKPDLILVDISMPVLSGIQAFKTIRRKDKDVKALFLTMYEGDEYVYFTRRIGAKGLLGKNTMKGELIYAIKTIAGGDYYFGKNYDDEKLKEIEKKYRQMIATDVVDGNIQLSLKERKVLELISKGMTSQEIANKLKYSRKTIEYHRSRLMQRLNIKSFPELITYAVKFSMVNKLFDEE